MIWQSSSQVTLASSFAFAMYVAGVLVFFAAKKALKGYRLTLAFSPDRPRHLVNRGIYSRVRHPFYLAYTLTWIAGSIAAPSIVTIGTTLCMLAAYLAAARIEEAKFKASSLGPAYATYREHTGIDLPAFFGPLVT
jgi:protein-S-isoprenylcysteine O-methyltransferase Ste14